MAKDSQGNEWPDEKTANSADKLQKALDDYREAQGKK